MTDAEELRNLLKAANLPAVPVENGERANKWCEIVQQFIDLVRKKKPRAPKGTPRLRNPLFDTLAKEMGADPLTLTRAAAKAVAVALADVLAVCPTLTVEEIQRRALAYKRRWPDRRNWSAPALAKHWANFGGGDPTRTGVPNAPEPKEDWRPAARQVAEETADVVISRARVDAMNEGQQWFQLGGEFKRLILDKMAAQRKPAA